MVLDISGLGRQSGVRLCRRLGAMINGGFLQGSSAEEDSGQEHRGVSVLRATS
ncbi:hypothetical protein M758_UG140900 [Ceratodon purpureus]|nr:hypothetical protein M758_UG140900 [Ceratodon purpureus]